MFGVQTTPALNWLRPNGSAQLTRTAMLTRTPSPSSLPNLVASAVFEKKTERFLWKKCLTFGTFRKAGRARAVGLPGVGC